MWRRGAVRVGIEKEGEFEVRKVDACEQLHAEVGIELVAACGVCDAQHALREDGVFTGYGGSGCDGGGQRGCHCGT